MPDVPLRTQMIRYLGNIKKITSSSNTEELVELSGDIAFLKLNLHRL